MSRAETLAGLAEAIADEILERAAPRETELGEFEEPQASYGPGFIADLACGLDVKALAAVALAWLEGQMTEQFGVHQDGFTVRAADEADARKWADRVYSPVYRRYVTAWVPVETGEDAR